MPEELTDEELDHVIGGAAALPFLLPVLLSLVQWWLTPVKAVGALLGRH